MVETGAAIFLRQGGTEEAQFTHFGHDGAVERLFARRGDDAGQELVLRIAARGLLDHTLFLGEPAAKIQRVFPVEGLRVD